MDDSNRAIQFDEHGQCSCCRDALIRLPNEWWPNAEGERRLEQLVKRLRAGGRGRPYDAIIGLSGGVDSAYLAHVLKHKYDLRLLAVHVDGGWNSDQAVRNIETIVRTLNLDLFTYVVEWQQMREVQVAFLKASVLNQDIPQDHAFFSVLYQTAGKFGVKYFLSGVNFATESIIPPESGHPYMDVRHIRGVHRQFGKGILESFPLMDLSYFVWLSRVRKQLLVFRPLNYLPYNKEIAAEELKKHYDWRDYGTKHHESRFTKFYQQIYLPRKVFFDKRRLHLSSLIVSQAMTREQALQELAKPIIDEKEAARDVKFVAKKLGCAHEDLNVWINRRVIPHRDYPNRYWLHATLTWMRDQIRRFE
ncbi:MAG: N-acetyl sugar amidotransferase [Sulfuritalea sp.]|jgi:N-acetyl sugar amidotransferase|nr:N-acetyl sugar amidotransferase [Sulfuritalea sp.]